MTRPRACTVAFIGVDGSGKSTVAARLAEWLHGQGTVVHLVKIRSGRSGLDRQASEQGHHDLAGMVGNESAAMMMAAVTWQSIRDTKAMRRDPDAVVLLDRSTHCALALASLQAPATVAPISQLFDPLPRADLVVHVRVDAEVASARLRERGGTPQTTEFLSAFDAAYRALPDAADFLVVDGNLDADTVFTRVRDAVVARFGERLTPTRRAPAADIGAPTTR